MFEIKIFLFITFIPGEMKKETVMKVCRNTHEKQQQQQQKHTFLVWIQAWAIAPNAKKASS